MGRLEDVADAPRVLARPQPSLVEACLGFSPAGARAYQPGEYLVPIVVELLLFSRIRLVAGVNYCRALEASFQDHIP